MGCRPCVLCRVLRSTSFVSDPPRNRPLIWSGLIVHVHEQLPVALTRLAHHNTYRHDTYPGMTHNPAQITPKGSVTNDEPVSHTQQLLSQPHVSRKRLSTPSWPLLCCRRAVQQVSCQGCMPGALLIVPLQDQHGAHVVQQQGLFPRPQARS